MTQVGIGTFNRVSLAFIIHRIVNGRPIKNRLVTLVIMALNTLCQHVLKFSTASLSAHFPGKYAAGFSIYKGQNVDPVFFSSMKV